MTILYLSYTGILEPLGQSQVFGYLERLAQNHKIYLISYERAHDWQNMANRIAVENRMKIAGIHWQPLRYHKKLSGLSTLLDLLVGFFLSTWISLRYHIQVVHARSYVPSVIALALKRLFGFKYIFDMRGFWADERVDGGIWQADTRRYRVAKWFERQFFLNADIIVSLTHAGVEEIKKLTYIMDRTPHFEVIPTCTNLNLFVPRPNAPQPTNKPFTLGYVGSVGTWYLLDEMIQSFKILRRHRPDARMLFINRNEHDLIRQRLSALDVPPDCVEIRSVNHAEVVDQMHRMDAGILLIKPVFSKKASAPTKLGEFLACGIPCLGNSDVGDVKSILEEGKIGVVLRKFEPALMEQAILRLLELQADPCIRGRCRSIAEQIFSLEKGVMAYDNVYQKLS